ncbi:Lipoprotein-releasing system ATP-binding protein LolD [Sodalis glossinidius str. 'morsitans']|uniref:ABC transporter ATP-binding protein n=1 Tax=Sodalis glossinidius (strain morsitans) TaxID=343509 RepID=Q2NV51_SODGM|nr:ATP-binding cassette domain-containing protein [Sodalis glossinidius]BAE73974.1 putative ABC transporter ATP-binding protein [Sodalis glossinidius str. 'morsitans']CRL44446.1 Lipoprotein-releasing system ATP-binding protein LolD [Sodalis glossinidius str. 'morsitans']
MPAENVLEVHHLSKHVGQGGEHHIYILTGVELVVKPAQKIALIGESGSGKLTLLGILAGLDYGSDGAVHLLGHDLTALNEELGFVFQSFMLVPTLTALENVHLPAQLSGGEQQRVALARAFIGRPQILFADEPTGNLDCATGDRIADELFNLNRDFATTLILVTHDRQLAAFCERRLRLQDGRLEEVV